MDHHDYDNMHSLTDDSEIEEDLSKASRHPERTYDEDEAVKKCNASSLDPGCRHER